jgi:fructosamine-3-kinase
MTELFGAFPNDFYSAYNEIKPIDSEYSNRRDLYNLYHVLNHLNLFGQTYLEAAKAIIDKYVE